MAKADKTFWGKDKNFPFLLNVIGKSLEVF